MSPDLAKHGAPIRVIVERHNEDGTHEITLRGSKDDMAQIAGALQYGMKWVRITASGVLQSTDVYTRLPDPIDDPELQDIWRHVPLSEDAPVQMRLFYDDPAMREPAREWSKNNRAIYLQSISGYAGREAYVERAKQLEAAGFVCLRSRRGDSGRYWEIWYLPSPAHGRGPIEAMRTTGEIMGWVMRAIGPGNLTTSGEQWGLAAD